MDLRVLEALKYHEHDDDDGRYRVLLCRADTRSRNSTNDKWFSTHKLPADQRDQVIALATAAGHIHHRMYNYHPERNAAMTSLLKEQKGRYEPVETPTAACITDNKRRKDRERASLLQRCKQEGKKPPPTEKQLKKKDGKICGDAKY